MKLRLTQDCEHGEKGKVLEIDEDRVPAFLAEGRCELVQDEPAPVEPAAIAPPAPKVEPPKAAPHRPAKGRR